MTRKIIEGRIDCKRFDDEQNSTNIERNPIEQLIERVPIVLSAIIVNIFWEVIAVVRS
jgi:hypothetical protein